MATRWLSLSTWGWAARDPAEVDIKLACPMGRAWLVFCTQLHWMHILTLALRKWSDTLLNHVYQQWGRGGGEGQAHVHSASNAQWNRLILYAIALIECFLCCFWELFGSLKLKHALWFAAAIGNTQFSQHGRWAHPYPGISPTFWQCRDVLPLIQKCSKHQSPGKLGGYERLLA